jgi:hypothetical protein
MLSAGEKVVKASLRVGLRPILDRFLPGLASPSQKGGGEARKTGLDRRTSIHQQLSAKAHGEGGSDERDGFSRQAGPDREPTQQAAEKDRLSPGLSSEASRRDPR